MEQTGIRWIFILETCMLQGKLLLKAMSCPMRADMLSSRQDAAIFMMTLVLSWKSHGLWKSCLLIAGSMQSCCSNVISSMTSAKEPGKPMIKRKRESLLPAAGCT